MNITLINDPNEWAELRGRLSKTKAVSFDLETDGLYGEILIASFSLTRDTAYVVPIYHKGGKLDGRKILLSLRQILLNRDVVLIGQNIIYDVTCLARQTGGGFPFKCKLEDSMNYDFMLNEEKLHRDLGTLVKNHLPNADEYKETIDNSKIAEYDLEEVVEYSGLDAIYPPAIIRSIREKLEKRGQRSERLEEYFRIVTPFAAAMQTYGFKIDMEVLNEEYNKEKESNAELLAKAQSFNLDLNLKSWMQLSRFIYEDLKCPVPAMDKVLAKNGMPKTDEKTLQRIHPRHPFIEVLLDYRKSTRQLSHYFVKTLEYTTLDGFVHPEYYVIKSLFGGTVSGRLAAKNPAVQTFSKSPIRKAYVSRYGDGGTLVGIDGNQMELRCLAHQSQDPTMLSTFRSGKDPHQATADLVGTSRQVGKIINFAGVYGVTPKGLHEQSEVSLSDAIKIVDTLKEAWKVAYEYIDKVKFFIIHNQYVDTPYGRYRRLKGASIYDGIGRYKLREGVNFVVQSVASDMVQLLGAHLWKELHPLAVPILSNHDGLLFDCRLQDVVEVLDKMGECVVQFPKLIEEVLGIELTLPFVFEAKIGPNWLDVEKETIRSFSTHVD